MSTAPHDLSASPQSTAALPKAVAAVTVAAHAPPAESPPPTVPGYEILEELGRGGMGIVYKARHKELNRLVALKMIQAGSLAGIEAKARFFREAEAVARLHHPNIVQIYDIGNAGGEPYFSLEFIDDGSLADRLKQAPLPPAGAAALLETLARAVHYAHQCQVIHRDLKPGNVLLTAGGLPKIADFGLARQLDGDPGLTETGAILGTPSYMAPEQARGAGEAIGPATDVYALGTLLYEMLTGRPPFLGASAHDTRAQVCEREPVPPRRLQPSAPRDLETICLKCLEKEPSRRYRSAEALADDVRRFLDGKPIQARRPAAWERAWKWAKRQPGIAALSALLLAATAGLVTREIVLRRAAEEESGRADRAAHANLVQAARLARGNWHWPQARGLYDRAIADAFPDQAELEVERLACLMANPERRELRAELARLQARADLPGPGRAAVLLYRGEVILADGEVGERRHADELIRQALTVPDGLGPADRAYANGLLAPGPLKAIEHFRTALREAPRHRANHALFMELVFCGQFDEARRRADFMLAMNPDDAVTHYGLAVIAALAEDQAGVKHHLERVRQLLDAKGHAAVERQLAFFLELPELNRRLHQRGPANGAPVGGPQAMMQALTQTLQGFKGLNVKFNQPVLGMPVPILGRPWKLLQAMITAQMALVRKDWPAAERVLEQAERDYPEGLLRLQHATAQLGLAGRHAKRGDWEAATRAAERARALARQAAAAPTLLPFGPYRHHARWLCVFMGAYEVARLRVDLGTGVTACLGGAALQGLPALAAAATLKVPSAGVAAERARRTRDDCLAVAVHSRGYDEARTDLLPLFVNWLAPEDARLLLTDWIDDEPAELPPLRLRAQLSLRLGNFGDALRDAERVLARVPGDRAMQAVTRAAHANSRQEK